MLMEIVYADGGMDVRPKLVPGADDIRRRLEPLP
jgi:hypothetical protein